MSRRKVIYFLSAFVLIIGCYALNLSYSLFTQNVATDDIVDSTIPPLEASISVESITIEAGKEYLVKQTITNNSLVPINYSISSDNLDKVSIATNPSIEDNTLTGIASASENKDIFLIISNNCDTCTTDLNVNFDFKYNYTTINDETIVTNITNTKEVTVVQALPYNNEPDTLKYHIINNFANTDLYTPSSSSSGELNLEETFSSNVNKVELPISGGSFEVPSPTTFTNVETNEVGLYATEDDYGTSYYFRGASSMNYVSFAGFTWRIVRINGDGSVRLILDGTLDKVVKNGESDAIYKNEKLLSLTSNGLIAFNVKDMDNAYVGYMYGTFNTLDPSLDMVISTSYSEAHHNSKSSTIKTYIDKFYEEYVFDYQEYLADTLFCGDKTRGIDNISYGYGIKSTKYASYFRNLVDENVISTLKCASSENDSDILTEEQRAYSRYTSKTDMSTTTINGILVNNDLDYPIALLSADELVLSGWFFNQSNNYYFLYNQSSATSPWWTLSPSMSTRSRSLCITNMDGSNGGALVSTSNSVRPVINLRSEVIVTSGDGTKDTSVGEGPYEVSLPS